jgi:hypothetical protein
VLFHGWLFELVERTHGAAARKLFATKFADIPQDGKNFYGVISVLPKSGFEQALSGFVQAPTDSFFGGFGFLSVRCIR